VGHALIAHRVENRSPHTEILAKMPCRNPAGYFHKRGNSMLVFGHILWCISVFILFASLWAMVCNHRTFKQKGILLKNIGAGDRVPSYDGGDIEEFCHKLDSHANEFDTIMQEYQNVSYDRHLLHLFFLRDARELYSPKLKPYLW
jgi:hypothetical protein